MSFFDNLKFDFNRKVENIACKLRGDYVYNVKMLKNFIYLCSYLLFFLMYAVMIVQEHNIPTMNMLGRGLSHGLFYNHFYIEGDPVNVFQEDIS